MNVLSLRGCVVALLAGAALLCAGCGGEPAPRPAPSITTSAINVVPEQDIALIPGVTAGRSTADCTTERYRFELVIGGTRSINGTPVTVTREFRWGDPYQLVVSTNGQALYADSIVVDGATAAILPDAFLNGSQPRIRLVLDNYNGDTGLVVMCREPPDAG